GSFHMDHTMDFICPVARNIMGVATMLETIAGEDERDPQWVRGPIITDQYTEYLKNDVSNLRIGVLKEGFGWEFSDNDVDEQVLKAVETLHSLGANVQEVSLPLWKDALPIWQTLLAHSFSTMIESEGQGYWHGGMTVSSF